MGKTSKDKTPPDNDQAEVKAKNETGRQGDGGVYLVVYEESEDFMVALRYTAHYAKANRAHLGILNVISIEEFVHWGKVEERMRQEMREKAEKKVWAVCKEVGDMNGLIPSIYMEEGEMHEVLVDLLERDHGIKLLVLGARTGASGPGPLVSHFSGKGISKLHVPLVIVPDHVSLDEIVNAS